ncbi:MAG: T9SS-dependent M36 family metallopeptidase [Altibacter sp.]|uniref:T9SS-dependent M36 family metallopeptidase n=1 Tax=Altibacter sp. TaxID=2024823 RepID=UPI001DFB62B1|nr:T9SS-dependent M36 family metallopeptidase [Altibacter sp.]MBZ0328085.1 T9SS-dependent M36 family metallopeptidase [Altibacter sp.]
MKSTLLFLKPFLANLSLSALVLLFSLFIFQTAEAQTTKASQKENKSVLKDLIQTENSNYVITDEHISSTSGIRHVYVRQAIGGIEVVGTESSVHLDNEGTVIVEHNNLLPNISATIVNASALITAEEAIVSVAGQMGYVISELNQIEQKNNREFVFNKAGISTEDIPVKQLYYYRPTAGTSMIYELSIQETTTSDWWNFRVDASTGSIIDKDNWTVYCELPSKIKSDDAKTVSENHNTFNLFKPQTTLSFAGSYNVFPMPIESPNHGSRSIVSNPDDANASPYGWHDTNGASGPEYTTTRGNNVLAQEDVNGNNGTGTMANGGAGLNFNFPLDLSQQPIVYQNAALTNLFFWNNIMHDVYYQYGFDEASGNFQQNNYGNGGLGNDYVLADAQDGSGINNANFGTPTDGNRPRMQMFLWDPAPPMIQLTINAPGSLAGTYNVVQAGFGPDVPTSPITTNFALFNDNTAPDNYDGCQAAVNAGALNGKIVLIRRGNCNFTDKVVRAENAGAVAVIVVNNAPGAPIIMGGTDPGIGIPSVMISQTDGEAMITALLNTTTVNGTLVGTAAGTVNIDGDLDNGIIAHEYGHGISNRLTGGPSNTSCLGNAEQMGEGWSDFFGLMLTIEAGDTRTDARGIGTYAIGESIAGNGIRPAPYSTDFATNPFTYADTNDTGTISQPHGIGFVWCTMLWDMTWDLIDKYGYDPDVYYGTGGNNIAMKLVVEGLKLNPCNPGFVTGRNAILAADLALYGGANQCLIWNAFAKRGLGASASQGSSSSRTDQTEAFDLPSTTYNGSWSNGTPALGKIAIFNQNYNTTAGNIEACSCEINSGSTVTVAADDYMLIEGDITVDGALIVEHTGSVVQIDKDAVVTKAGGATINVEVDTPILQTRDFMVMGSPMDAETRTGVFNSAFLVLKHTPANFMPHPSVPLGGTNFADENGDFWSSYSGSIDVGEGYIVRPQSGYTDPANHSYPLTYSLGTLNNGDVSRSIIFNGLGPNPDGTPNVIANPYPSAISASQFIADNSLVTQIYFWEHLTPPSSSIPGAGSINFSMDDISMYIDGGALPAANDPGTSTEPNGVISTGQGFGFFAQAAGTITFTNSMRLTTGNTTLRKSVDVDKVLLKVRNEQYNIGSHALVAFNPNATADLDENYDADRLATTISLYSHLEDGTEQLGIQSREAFDSQIKVPMGFASQVDADAAFIVSIENIEGLNLGTATVYFIDNQENTIHNLSNGPYEFRSSKGTFNQRFTLLFEPEVILGDEEDSLERIVLFPNPTNDVLNIHAPQSQIMSIVVYDVRGRQIKAVDLVGQSSYQLDLSRLETAMYFVTVNTDNGSITKRIVKE